MTTPQTSTPLTSTPLEYAPQRWGRRRLKRLFLLTVALMVAVACVIWRGEIRYAFVRGRFLYAQHRCMTLDAPSDRVAYEEDPARLQALLQDSDYQVRFDPTGKPVAALWWPKVVRDWPEIRTYRWTSTVPGIIFMHEMKTPKGRRVLVFSTAAYRPDVRDGVEIRVQAVEPATWSRPSASAHGMATILVKPPRDRDAHVPREKVGPVRIYAGRVDPADPARFTVDYEGGGHHGFMEARLRDGDHYPGVDIDWGCRTTGWATPR